ncbi:MAG: methylenetetrahydrofolate--tRNA-(uracil(54)-C(5))-methyltransferase (FADH(2)-oxidizing) TrmFO [Chloroflexi bacterium HGW-Chloroflexi-2]|nr:MAG: methylenetetrahydrofolate--tRNA-(uracil(54)-C(5))-methyltransferase (FADH(2)-oxidizing) TrmFO [Chloroflexi bacterium HGW-Chloroflexi-2]
MENKTVTVIGAGLAGSEAAYQLAMAGFQVNLYEMRPLIQTGAHTTDYFAELICSNSLGSNLPDRAAGVLKNELRRLGSLLMKIADEFELPAGGALAVDRDLFSGKVTRILSTHPNIKIFREEVKEIPSNPTIIASGPLTSSTLSQSISQITNSCNLFFYDAIAPIINYESINLDIAFRASRYQKDEEESGDYINCPFSKEEYDRFVFELTNAQRIELKNFESQINQGVKAGSDQYFEGCLPIEVLANRGEKSLAFGPLRPVGIWNPHGGKRPYAVLQLRQDNIAGTLYNMVGFQTNLKFSEQKRVFQMIPGLENATFARYGQMHRNTFIASPNLLLPTLQFNQRNDLFFAGQITGVEGYVGNIATGLLAGINMSRYLSGHKLLELPKQTMLGALVHYITHASMRDFQPMKANFGILPLINAKGKRERAKLYAQEAKKSLEIYLSEIFPELSL